MRHVTWNAISTLTSGEAVHGKIRACDWQETDEVGTLFDATAARALVRGEKERPLPDCPKCAVLVDEALTLRGAA